MKIIDAHCDTLLKLAQDDTLDFYKRSENLHVQYRYLEKSNVVMQVFALFVPPSTPSSTRFQFLLQMIDAFYERMIRPGKMELICSAQDIDKLFQSKARRRGGLLSLEGADALQGDVVRLRILYRLGLRALGFTWNHRNEAADGVEEPNPGGLSQFGRQLLDEANRLGILLDVSHLSEPSFWDTLALSRAPVIASHSNCKTVCHHPRNLTDEQIKALIQNDGVIGLTFVPQFISGNEKVQMKDLLKHLDHILSLGGENHVAFGSDFDGISRVMSDLRHAGQYHLLVNELLKRYNEEQIEKWLSRNWRRVFSAAI